MAKNKDAAKLDNIETLLGWQLTRLRMAYDDLREAVTLLGELKDKPSQLDDGAEKDLQELITGINRLIETSECLVSKWNNGKLPGWLK